MPDGHHIFLSYRSTERPFALKVGAALRNAGVPIWVDCLPEGIRPGDDWPRSLEAALDTCAAMVVLLSPDYARSEICRRELGRVDQRGRAIYPVLLSAVAPAELPLELQRLQHIDFTSASDQDAFRVACDKLLSRLQDGRAPIGQRPDPERQYLLTLISNLEATGGISQYVALDAELSPRDEDRARKLPRFATAWGLDAEFFLLEAEPQAPPHGRRPSPAQPVRAILDLVQSPRVFALLGDPGAGKSTTLRRLALEMARARLGDRLAPLPVLLPLPQWRDEPDPQSFIAARCPFAGDPRSAIAAGDIALFLDGLNEMGRDSVVHLAQLRQWLASSDSPKRLVVTCRRQDFEELHLEVDRVAIEPMNRARVQQFVTGYLGGDAPSLLQRILPDNDVADERSLFTIARNPYLLSCLILLHKSSADEELPRNMGRLFSQLARFLWKRELQRQTTGWVPFEEAEAKFAALAFAMLDERRPTSVPREYVRATIDDALVRVGERASLLEAEGMDVRFHHQLIQEYFAAVALARLPLESRIGDSRWSEVIIALSGIHDEPDTLIDLLRSKNLRLAARCLIAGAMAADDTRARVVRDLARDLDAAAALVKEAEDYRAKYIEEHRDLSWSSTQMMDDALDSHFGPAFRDVSELGALLKALGGPP